MLFPSIPSSSCFINATRELLVVSAHPISGKDTEKKGPVSAGHKCKGGHGMSGKPCWLIPAVSSAPCRSPVFCMLSTVSSLNNETSLCSWLHKSQLDPFHFYETPSQLINFKSRRKISDLLISPALLPHAMGISLSDPTEFYISRNIVFSGLVFLSKNLLLINI